MKIVILIPSSNYLDALGVLAGFCSVYPQRRKR